MRDDAREEEKGEGGQGEEEEGSTFSVKLI